MQICQSHLVAYSALNVLSCFTEFCVNDLSVSLK